VRSLSPIILTKFIVLLFSGKVFSHGFVNAADGRKMSKSYNNTIDPFDVSGSMKHSKLNIFSISSYQLFSILIRS
jgi:isoleucyl-tRNA synthetase